MKAKTRTIVSISLTANEMKSMRFIVQHYIEAQKPNIIEVDEAAKDFITICDKHFLGR